MNAIALFRTQLTTARWFFDNTLANATPEQLHWLPSPPHEAIPIAGHYAHVVVVEDVGINVLLRKGNLLATTTWAGKTGVSELPPLPTPDTGGLPLWTDWARRVRVDAAALREYTQVVYKSTDDYLTTLSDKDLDTVLDLSILGAGQQTLAWALNLLVLSNMNLHCGEISCLKGLRGAKGYPI